MPLTFIRRCSFAIWSLNCWPCIGISASRPLQSLSLKSERTTGQSNATAVPVRVPAYTRVATIQTAPANPSSPQAIILPYIRPILTQPDSKKPGNAPPFFVGVRSAVRSGTVWSIPRYPLRGSAMEADAIRLSCLARTIAHGWMDGVDRKKAWSGTGEVTPSDRRPAGTRESAPHRTSRSSAWIRRPSPLPLLLPEPFQPRFSSLGSHRMVCQGA